MQVEVVWGVGVGGREELEAAPCQHLSELHKAGRQVAVLIRPEASWD